MRHPLTAIFGTERHLVQIYSAIARISSDLVEISSEPVEISSELVEISSELISTNSELLIISTFINRTTSVCVMPVSRSQQPSSRLLIFSFVSTFVKSAMYRIGAENHLLTAWFLKPPAHYLPHSIHIPTTSTRFVHLVANSTPGYMQFP